MYQFNARDLKIIQQRAPLGIRLKIDVYDERNGNHLDQLECGFISGSLSVSAESDIRRTANIVVVPVKNKRLKLDKNSIIWMNRIVKLQIGIHDNHYRKWNYYPVGVYVFTDYGANYDATTNQISLNLSDLWVNFNGNRNGQIGGAETTKFTAYDEDIDTGEVIRYNYIRDAVITTLLQLGKLKEGQLHIDDIGEFKGIEEYNSDYLKYREESMSQVKDGTYMPTWNAIPYDKDFPCGTNVAEILLFFRDLYPNYEMYFDENGDFVCKMTPSCYYQDIVFDSNFFDKVYISENTSVDLCGVKNVCEVWGKSIGTDFFTEDCTYQNNCYSCNINSYDDKYYNGDLVAIKIPKENQPNCSLNINGFGAISIIDENTESPIDGKILEPEQIYVFKIKKKRVNKNDEIRAYLLGQFQPHAVNILTNGNRPVENYTAQDGSVVKKYSKEYFQKIYNCKTVNFMTVPDSPFSIEELGLLLDVKTGDEYENITSDSLASARAEYENWKNSRLTDSISVTTTLCPFADVNIKVSYRRKDTNEINQYIVKSINHDPSSGTTSWTLMRFYPLYMNEILLKKSTWGNLSDYTWGELEKYTWKQIME